MNEDKCKTTDGLDVDKGSKAVEFKTDEDEWKRKEDGTFGEGNKGGGAKKQTEEQKLKKKAQKELIADYKQGLVEALKEIEPVLIEKGIKGDMIAIKEINDRAMGKSMQAMEVSGKDGERFTISFDNTFEKYGSSTQCTTKDSKE